MTDKNLFDKLGRSAYIRNGVGYGFISDDELYDNCWLEIGIGRVRSGRGDWGGGFEYATDSPLKITIDKNYIIRKVETSSFYNNTESKRVEDIAKKIAQKLKVGSVFHVVDTEFKRHIDTILNFIPCKSHIGHDVFEYPHMLEHYTKEDTKDVYRFDDSKWLSDPQKRNYVPVPDKDDNIQKLTTKLLIKYVIILVLLVVVVNLLF